MARWWVEADWTLVSCGVPSRRVIWAYGNAIRTFLIGIPEGRVRGSSSGMSLRALKPDIKNAEDSLHSFPDIAKKLLSYSDTFSDGNLYHGNANDIFGGSGEDFKVLS